MKIFDCWICGLIIYIFRENHYVIGLDNLTLANTLIIFKYKF